MLLSGQRSRPNGLRNSSSDRTRHPSVVSLRVNRWNPGTPSTFPVQQITLGFSSAVTRQGNLNVMSGRSGAGTVTKNRAPTSNRGAWGNCSPHGLHSGHLSTAMNVRHTASVPAGIMVDVTILTGMASHLMPVPRQKSKTIVRKRAGGCQPGGALTGVIIGDAPWIAAAEGRRGFEPTTAGLRPRAP